MNNEKPEERFENVFPLIRRTVGWSAETFGEKIGVSRQTINNLENKKYKLTKTAYIAMRYVLDEEMKMHEDETEMLKVVLDAFVDHPEKYTEEAKKNIYSKASLLSQAIVPAKKETNRKEVSKEWKAILIGIGAITAAAVSAILIGSWKKK